MSDYIRTFSGLKFPTKPDFRAVSILDIAHGLSMSCRWGGHCKVRYSVAAHSIHVAMMVPPAFRYQALLHDASEAYFCDIPKPFKELLPDYKRVENELMIEISKALNFRWPLDDIVKQADAAALYLERKALFNSPVGNDVPHVLPPVKCVTWDFEKWAATSPRLLKEMFLDYATKY